MSDDFVFATGYRKCPDFRDEFILFPLFKGARGIFA
jgi:hypothetical protein